MMVVQLFILAAKEQCGEKTFEINTDERTPKERGFDTMKQPIV